MKIAMKFSCKNKMILFLIISVCISFITNISNAEKINQLNKIKFILNHSFIIMNFKYIVIQANSLIIFSHTTCIMYCHDHVSCISNHVFISSYMQINCMQSSLFLFRQTLWKCVYILYKWHCIQSVNKSH